MWEHYTFQIEMDHELDQLVGLLAYFIKPVESRLLVMLAIADVSHPLYQQHKLRGRLSHLPP